jgi:YHS domain-containing protein
MVRDPVCGMNVDEKTAKMKVTYRGKAYYFCSAACLEAFSRSPQMW